MPSRLKAAIPKLASLNIERSVAFFEHLGFTRRYSDKDYPVDADARASALPRKDLGRAPVTGNVRAQSHWHGFKHPHLRRNA